MEWLQFAKDANGDKRTFAEKVLHHVGFNDSDIDFENRYRMLVFDFDLMDGAWQELGKQSFQSVWDDMFSYLGGGFQVWIVFIEI